PRQASGEEALRAAPPGREGLAPVRLEQRCEAVCEPPAVVEEERGGALRRGAECAGALQRERPHVARREQAFARRPRAAPVVVERAQEVESDDVDTKAAQARELLLEGLVARVR